MNIYIRFEITDAKADEVESVLYALVAAFYKLISDNPSIVFDKEVTADER